MGLLGIAREAFSLLAELYLNDNGYRQEAVLTLGKQSGIVSRRQMNSVLRSYGRSNSRSGSHDEYDFYRSNPSDLEIFESLGFVHLDRIDSSPYEGANIIHDLNLPLPLEHSQRYDLVFDGGTSEHVFDQLQVLQTCFELCREGGVIVHYTPANNFLDHGYFQPQPSFYQEYYEANRFEILQSFLIESKQDWVRKRRVFQYATLGFDEFSFGGHWSKNMLGNWFAVRKLDESTCRAIPQQKRSLMFQNSQQEFGKNDRKGFFRQAIYARPKLRYLLARTIHWTRRFIWFVLPKKKRRPHFIKKV